MREIARVPKLAPYIDFPIEHASDRMLKKMNRRTTGKRMRDSINAFREANCKLLTLSRFSTLVEIAAKKGYIKHDEIELLKKWSKNPEEWGKQA